MTEWNYESEDDQNYWYGPQVATFGDRVVAAREHAGMSVSDFAKRLGVKKTTIENWEDDQSEPRANKLQMISGILGVSVIWLLTGEGEELSAPETGEEINADALSLLTEIRDIKAQLKRSSEQLGRLEKRLRTQVNG
jgi:transcriptional regulator with XRE-family HTH domain